MNLSTRALTAAVALAAALTLTACGNEPAPAAPDSTTSEVHTLTDDTAAAPLLEGPASEPADFGNGITARILSVGVLPPGADPYPSFEDVGHAVRLVVEVTNNGTEIFEFPATRLMVTETAMFGPNWAEGRKWFTDGDASELPARLVPGTSATTASLFTLPAEGLSDLTFVFNPNPEVLAPYTFLDVEELVQGY